MEKLDKKHVRYGMDIDFVRQLIEDAMMGVVGACSIVNIYAIAGFGKSDFLANVKEGFRRKLPTTLVRVTDFVEGGEGTGYRLDLMLRHMISDLQDGLPAWTRMDFSVGVEQLGVTQLADQVEKLTYYALENDRIALILVDDYDRLPPGARVLFDEIILSRVVTAPRRAVVVLTSEQELTFTDRLDLKAYLKTRRLSQFTEDDIKITTPQYAELAEEILKWTGGLSELVEFLVKELGKHSIGTLEEYYAHQKELLKGAYRKHVRQIAFGDLPELTRQTMPILALLRRFDVSTLRNMLPQIIPDFKPYTVRQYLDLIDQLGSRIQWRDEGGYALNDALRTILSNYERVYEPATYRKVHRVAERMYEEWLQERYRNYYLREMLYHRIAQETSSTQADLPGLVQLVSGILLEYTDAKRTPGPCDGGDVDKLRDFKESLEQDEDLNRLISAEVWSAIRAREMSITGSE